MRSSRSDSSAGRAARVWVHARLLEKTPRRSLSEVDIYNEDGRLAARVRGLRSHRVAGGREESLDDLLYAYQWRPEPPSEPDLPAGTRNAGSSSRTRAASAPGSRNGCWLAAMRSPWSRSTSAPLSRNCGDGHYRINPGRPEDLLRLVAGRHRGRSSALPRRRPPVEPRRTASGRTERGGPRGPPRTRDC